MAQVDAIAEQSYVAEKIMLQQIFYSSFVKESESEEKKYKQNHPDMGNSPCI